MFGAIAHAARTKYEQEVLGVQLLQHDGVFSGRRRDTDNASAFIIADIEFADDCVLLAESEED
jgi:hypothetical protein